MCILSCCLKFTPTLTGNNIYLKSDIQAFSPKLRLAEFFDNTSKNAFDKDISSQPLIKNESKFYPVKYRNKELDQYIDSLNNLHIENINKSFTYNLSKREWIELNQLKNNLDIVNNLLNAKIAVV